MNKTKIEWCDYTWNPVTGCLHGCDYCYARRIAERFSGGGYGKEHGMFISKYREDAFLPPYDLKEPQLIKTKADWYRKAPYPFGFAPTFHRYRLNGPQQIKKPSRIFVVSMGDLFGEWVPDEWITDVFKACNEAPQHTYIFLTKNPLRYTKEDSIFHAGNSKRNWWFGTTITTQIDYNERAGKLPLYRNGFLSIEPILEQITLNRIHQMPIRWVIVGAQTGPGAIKPKPEWVQSIIEQCRAADVPLFLKDNLGWHEEIKEFPQCP